MPSDHQKKRAAKKKEVAKVEIVSWCDDQLRRPANCVKSYLPLVAHWRSFRLRLQQFRAQIPGISYKFAGWCSPVTLLLGGAGPLQL